MKRDIPALFADIEVWKHSFMAISKHRLQAHYMNPTAADDDVVLLLAYIDNELVGYMGVYVDEIILNGLKSKIGWLSTWWVHPKTKGSGIGREILNTMYGVNNGKIGISQFTPSAKRVYDKSGYFYTLKENNGVKAVLKSHLAYLMPQKYPSIRFLMPIFESIDFLINIPIAAKLFFCKKSISGKLNGVIIEYLNIIDQDTRNLIEKYSQGHISPKSNAFFEWLKAYTWVQDAPLLNFTENGKYEFSIYDKSFDIYLVKIIKNEEVVGFLVLQKRDKTIKVLFAYYDMDKDAKLVSDIIKLHCINLKAKEIICYDAGVNEQLKHSAVFIYTRKKLKQSIISKVFGKDNFDDVTMNFGDGDCSFA